MCDNILSVLFNLICPKLQVAAPLAVQDRHKFIFNLRTPNRVYFLAADSEGEMNKWVNCLCQVCGLKTVDDDAESEYFDFMLYVVCNS